MAVIYIYPYKIYKIYISWISCPFLWLSIHIQAELPVILRWCRWCNPRTYREPCAWVEFMCNTLYISVYMYTCIHECCILHIYDIHVYTYIYIYNVYIYIYDIIYIYILRILNISVLLVNSHRFRLTGSPVGKTLNPVLRPLLVRRLPQFGLKNQDKKKRDVPSGKLT